MERNQKEFRLEQAIQQFIGFRHAKEGYDIDSLVEAMGLTHDEWNEISDEVPLSDADKDSIAEFFLNE